MSEHDEVKEETEVHEDEEDILHILEPRHEPAEIILVHNGHTRRYLQKPLSYFNKMEFMGLVGKTLDAAMKGDGGLSVNNLFDSGPTPTSMSDLTAGDFADLDSFLSLVSKIAGYAPDFLKECYLIWLSVPKAERAWARDALDTITDEQGFEIIERFIDQNWEALEGFFLEQVPKLFRRVASHRNKRTSEELLSTH